METIVVIGVVGVALAWSVMRLRRRVTDLGKRTCSGCGRCGNALTTRKCG